MSETSFTPGPWSKWGPDKPDSWNVTAANHVLVAQVVGAPNSDLIIAAPDLYEALGSLLEDTQHSHHPDCTDGPCPVALARAALAKARGER